MLSSRLGPTGFVLAHSFERAFERIPVDGLGDLQDLEGPFHLWAVMTDDGIDPADGS
ncbi:MAG TPA: hypothetical protein VM848_12345 [Acidimicrobiia bacterium]|nr:hypothetical protein [Acidimicrobiia bacterium]